MKILTVLGARPQFIKAAAFSATLSESGREASAGGIKIEEKILHTGQHYDFELSEQIFAQLGIPRPYLNLGIGSMGHGRMTGEMLARIETEIETENPDWILVYGDTNSTLAGALAGAKVHVPVCHVEAGLRSFDKRMPEEINRLLTDHISTLLFAPTHAAVENLKRENIHHGVHHVGDIMYDAAIRFGKIAGDQSKILKKLALKEFYLATVHRQENTDQQESLAGIFRAFDAIATPECPLVLPIHPRTSKMLEKHKIHPGNPEVRIIPPVPFLDMILLERNARAILTDSGGIQKEAYFHRTPCITLRDVTEWVETVDAGWNQVVGANTEQIVRAVGRIRTGSVIEAYGSGKSAKEMIKLLIHHD